MLVRFVIRYLLNQVKVKTSRKVCAPRAKQPKQRLLTLLEVRELEVICYFHLPHQIGHLSSSGSSRGPAPPPAPSAPDLPPDVPPDEAAEADHPEAQHRPLAPGRALAALRRRTLWQLVWIRIVFATLFSREREFITAKLNKHI